MAITRFDLPADYKSAHDDLYVIAESDNINVVDFKFVIDVYAQNKQLIRAKIYPDPNTGNGYFDISNVVSNEMKFDWFLANDQVFMLELDDSGQIYLPVDVRVGEEVSGLTTLNMDSGTITVANFVPNLYQRQLIRYDNLNNYFITNRDKLNLSSNYNEDLFIGLRYSSNKRFEIKQFNSSNTQLSASDITLPNVTTTGIYQLNISPDSLAYSGITFSSQCEYYEVNFYNTIPNPDVLLDKVRVYFKCKTKYQPINLHFMNNYGLFESARFDLVNKLSMDKQTKNYQKLDVTFGNFANYFKYYERPNQFTNYIYNETKINFGSEYNWTYKLTMDYPSDTDYEWLNELIMSPLIYAEIYISSTQSEYYPVTIKNTNYEYSKHIFNRLRAFEIEIDMNQKRHGFRR